VFLVVYQRWHEFRGDAAASTWVYGIALRKGIGHRRLKRVHAARASLPEHAAPAVPPEQARALEDADRQRILQAALDKLGEPQRDVFVLYELEELPMREIAALLDVPLHTAYGRLYAAREELAAALRRLSLKGGWPGPNPRSRHAGSTAPGMRRTDSPSSRAPTRRARPRTPRCRA
jgi:RNA polymerase sigma-70 factor (ECF subfamily)